MKMSDKTLPSNAAKLHIQSLLPLGALPNTPEPSDQSAWDEYNDFIKLYVSEVNDQVVEDRGVSINNVSLGGIPTLEITPPVIDSDSKCILYLHGGAYCLYSAASTLTVSAPISAESKLRVFSIDYTLAPKKRWRGIYKEIEQSIRALIDRGYTAENICILGDSAGGALAAGAAKIMRDNELGNPAGLVLLSPWSDIASIGLSYEAMAKVEVSYSYEGQLKNCALAYAERTEFREPLVSPVYADFDETFPPTLIQGGTREIFLSNFVRLYQAIEQSGGQATLDLYEGMTHVFWGAAPDLPESNIARAKAVKFIRKELNMDRRAD